MDLVELVELERTTSEVDGHLVVRLEIRAKSGSELEFYSKDGVLVSDAVRFTVRGAR
jgi:hypothetical protein